jgi:hypothetical protein
MLLRRAREQLAPVYVWFTEDWTQLDLKEAKALIDVLCEREIVDSPTPRSTANARPEGRSAVGPASSFRRDNCERPLSAQGRHPAF